MSFCVNGSRFGPHQYYRDDAMAGRVLATCRENPVLVTGLRRIGKSWFLRRFEQILAAGTARRFANDGSPSEQPLKPGLPRTITILEGGADDLEPSLDAIVSLADPDRVLAIDELEKLVADASRAHLLDRIMSYRPLVLAAAPVIHELARERVPRLASFFEERCVPMVLRPLSRGERRALALQTCNPGEGVPDESAAMALWWDWGGHPLVLQQVGVLIRDRQTSDTQTLLNLVHAGLNLGGPRYGPSLAGETGLSKAQRSVLASVASGQAPSDDQMTAVLQDHGAIVLRKSRWTIENCVLRRHLQATSHAPPLEAPLRPATPRSSAPVRVFSWIHLSDLHFGAGSVKHRFDHRTVMRAIARDIEAHAPKAVDRILVTGDIAFSAKPDEYVEARGWLEKTASAAGVGLDRVRLVPGNHDVDRGLAGKALSRSTHHAARSGGIDLDTLLADAEARSVLAGKLGAYQKFAAGISGHPAPIDNGLDWFETIAANPARHGMIRLVGLSTVWISDEQDGNKESPLIPNMLLASGPIDATCGDAKPTEVVFVLCHHPPSWVHKDAAALLDREFARLPHVHLCGHVHDAGAAATTRFGRAGKAIRYVAGAAHGDPSESSRHGYAWGALRHDGARGAWEIGWAPRIYVHEHGEMRADATRHRLDADGFAWEPIECQWPAPAT